MNSTLVYVISQQVNRLLLGPAYIRGLVMLILFSGLSLVLVDRFMAGIWDQSNQLDREYREINAQLSRYEQNRDQVNRDYRQLITALKQGARIEEQLLQVNSDGVEAWLIDNAMSNDLQPSQIQVQAQLTDDQGEYFRIKFKLTGTQQGLERFLKILISEDYFLIWEKLMLDVIEINQFSLAISLKHYTQITHEKTTSS